MKQGIMPPEAISNWTCHPKVDSLSAWFLATLALPGETAIFLLMTPTSQAIENREIIERIFGCWPSFHDAEIHGITITRGKNYEEPQMDVSIHHWKMTGEVDSKGYYVLIHHTLTTLRFFNISELKLADFNHQNVLFDIEISEVSDAGPKPSFSVTMDSSYGCEASFKCGRIRVMSTVPFTKAEPGK